MKLIIKVQDRSKKALLHTRYNGGGGKFTATRCGDGPLV